MAIKKSDLYSSLWASCDSLRGGMDASQYKDYVLFMLFIKYISDKYANIEGFPDVNIPAGASFADMVAMKNSKDIGDRINKQVINALVEANPRLLARTDFPDFNDPNKLGEAEEMVARLTNLVAIFQKPELDFSKNHAEHDDILGDAYEFLMQHFAKESGKSKGQFYTPAEVSRIIAKVIGIGPHNAKASTTVHDPTCGSGSLLLKVADQAGKRITLEGQEKDVTTAGLARMNMILHDFTTASIVSGNTLTNPKFLDGANLKAYDYVVANPPFSDKAWSTGLTPSKDSYQRFGWGEPPGKQGDFAYLLHILRAMKSSGKGACILPHGVLFRGNAEAVIRRALVDSGCLKAIIGLPANLFFGTGIPACILVLDKENAKTRKAIFMIDAAGGYQKDGPKNRLREQDIHKIVDAFNKLEDIEHYCRMVTHIEIADPKNDYNLNLPRYIDSGQREDMQDIAGHLRGGIPGQDIDQLHDYWAVMPSLHAELFEAAAHEGYWQLCLPVAELKSAILGHGEFIHFRQTATAMADGWAAKARKALLALDKRTVLKVLIEEQAESLLAVFRIGQYDKLVDAYDIYQHLMDYWLATMGDDCYMVMQEGWVGAAQPRLIEEVKAKNKDNKPPPKIKPDLQLKKEKYQCELLPPALIIARWFASEQARLEELEAELVGVAQEMEELAEEHGGEDGLLADAVDPKGKITKASVRVRRKLARCEVNTEDECQVLNQYLALADRESSLNDQVKALQDALTESVLAKYEALTESEVQQLVIDGKWLAHVGNSVNAELERVSQALTGRIRELAERYTVPLPELEADVALLATRVKEHLKTMGFPWY